MWSVVLILYLHSQSTAKSLTEVVLQVMPSPITGIFPLPPSTTITTSTTRAGIAPRRTRAGGGTTAATTQIWTGSTCSPAHKVCPGSPGTSGSRRTSLFRVARWCSGPTDKHDQSADARHGAATFEHRVGPQCGYHSTPSCAMVQRTAIQLISVKFKTIFQSWCPGISEWKSPDLCFSSELLSQLHYIRFDNKWLSWCFDETN